jgi:Protein of unknown function (DUF4038)
LRSDFSIRCQNDFFVKTWFCEGWHCGFGWRSGDRNRHSGKKENEQIVEHAKALPRVRVHKGGHLLEAEDGEPFWLGDTAWQLIVATSKEESSYYLHTRSRQGFRVIQTVVLFDGIKRPAALGIRPFSGDDPRHPEAAYFKRVQEIVREAPRLDFMLALVPVWGEQADGALG